MEKEKEILVSIVIPCYNHGAYIQDAIDSVEQNNADDFFEIIIINDGSKDAYTLEKLDELSKKGYHIIHQENKGLSAARNAGIRVARGRYILPLDSDNKITAAYYRQAMAILDAEPQVGVVYSDRYVFGLQQGNIPVGEFALQRILPGNFIDACAVFRKSIWEEIGGYDEHMPGGIYEDWEFWLSCIERGHGFRYMNEPLFGYRVLEASLVQKSLDPIIRRKVVEHIITKHATLYTQNLAEVVGELHALLAHWENANIQNHRDFDQKLHAIQVELATKVQDYENRLVVHQNQIEQVRLQLEMSQQELAELRTIIQGLENALQLKQNHIVNIEQKAELLQAELKMRVQYIDALNQLIVQYESRIKGIEGTRTWKVRQQYYKFRGIFKSGKKRKLRIPGLGFIKKIIFFTFGKGKIMTRRLFKKIFKHLYLWLEEFPVRIIPVKDLGMQVAVSNDPYHQWMMRNFPREAEFRQYKRETDLFTHQPLVSILLPVYNPPEELFKQTLNSVLGQIYENWELCIADDASTNKNIHKILAEYQKKDFRIKVNYRAENGHISKASNTALEMATGEFSLLLDHDDLLSSDCLYHVVKRINEKPEVDLIYSDEDKIDEAGVHSVPHFKPQWCPDHFTSRNYFGHVVVCRTSILNEIGGFRVGFEGSQDYDLLLRFTEKTQRIEHIAQVLYHWRIHQASAAQSEDAKPYAYIAAQRALTESFERKGEPAEVSFLHGFRGYSIRYKIKQSGKVSIIIPTKDNAEVLGVCIQSIFEKTTYKNFEVIVISNNSVEPALFSLLNKWQAKYPDQFKWMEHNIPFNFSQLMNFGRTQAQGDYLLLLNNDTEVITPDWLEAMVEQAQRPSIGVVGVKLLYPDNTIQHAGVIIGLGGIAGHTFVGMHKDEAGYFNYIQSINNYSAVTAACCMVKTSDYDLVGGFTEAFEVEYNDVDFCLKLMEAGRYNVYLPHVELYHYESLTRGHPHMNKESYDRHLKELELFKSRWQHFIDDDPCYNQHLTRGAHDFRIAL
jgi:glycosyltransferase involved in cell wall biosynthesis